MNDYEQLNRIRDDVKMVNEFCSEKEEYELTADDKLKSITDIASDYGIEFHGNHSVGTVEFGSIDEFKEMCLKVAEKTLRV